MQPESEQEDALAVSPTEVVVDRGHNRPLLLHLRRHRLTEENPRKALVQGDNVFLEGKDRKRAKNPHGKVCESAVRSLTPSCMSKLQVCVGMQIRRPMSV